jgi:hypothetical protein
MTQEEIKFALRVEEALNRVPFTEYRQLIVEACVIFTSIALGDARLKFIFSFFFIKIYLFIFFCL